MPKTPKLLVVHWNDAATGPDKEPDDEFCRCVSVGWLVRKDRYWLVLAPERGEGKYQREFRGEHWRIPRRWIERMSEVDYE